MKKLLSFTCLAMCACLLASCNPAGTSDTAATQAGVTYADDRQMVVDKIQSLVDAGVYPSPLF